jgi:hypothetical protein
MLPFNRFIWQLSIFQDLLKVQNIGILALYQFLLCHHCFVEFFSFNFKLAETIFKLFILLGQFLVLGLILIGLAFKMCDGVLGINCNFLGSFSLEYLMISQLCHLITLLLQDLD